MRARSIRTGVIAISMLVSAALISSGRAEACSAPAPPKPPELVEQAMVIVHVIVRGACSEPGRECAPLNPSSSTPSTDEAPAKAKPYAPGWPPIASAPEPNRPLPRFLGEAAYELLAMEVIEVLKGAPLSGTLAIRGELVLHDDYNDREPPYTFVRREGRRGNCFAYAYRRGAEYLLFLRQTNNVLTPYWSPHGPVNEQVRSNNDPWIAWVRRQSAGK
jgi:hypothetical protein